MGKYQTAVNHKRQKKPVDFGRTIRLKKFRVEQTTIINTENENTSSGTVLGKSDLAREN